MIASESTSHQHDAWCVAQTVTRQRDAPHAIYAVETIAYAVPVEEWRTTDPHAIFEPQHVLPPCVLDALPAAWSLEKANNLQGDYHITPANNAPLPWTGVFCIRTAVELTNDRRREWFEAMQTHLANIATKRSHDAFTRNSIQRWSFRAVEGAQDHQAFAARIDLNEWCLPTIGGGTNEEDEDIEDDDDGRAVYITRRLVSFVPLVVLDDGAHEEHNHQANVETWWTQQWLALLQSVFSPPEYHHQSSQLPGPCVSRHIHESTLPWSHPTYMTYWTKYSWQWQMTSSSDSNALLLLLWNRAVQAFHATIKGQHHTTTPTSHLDTTTTECQSTSMLKNCCGTCARTSLHICARNVAASRRVAAMIAQEAKRTLLKAESEAQQQQHQQNKGDKSAHIKKTPATTKKTKGAGSLLTLTRAYRECAEEAVSAMNQSLNDIGMKRKRKLRLLNTNAFIASFERIHHASEMLLSMMLPDQDDKESATTMTRSGSMTRRRGETSKASGSNNASSSSSTKSKRVTAVAKAMSVRAPFTTTTKLNKKTVNTRGADEEEVVLSADEEEGEENVLRTAGIKRRKVLTTALVPLDEEDEDDDAEEEDEESDEDDDEDEAAEAEEEDDDNDQEEEAEEDEINEQDDDMDEDEEEDDVDNLSDEEDDEDMDDEDENDEENEDDDDEDDDDDDEDSDDEDDDDNDDDEEDEAPKTSRRSRSTASSLPPAAKATSRTRSAAAAATAQQRSRSKM